MPVEAQPEATRKAAPTRAQRILAALVAGASLDEIGVQAKLTRRKTEQILRDELRRRWIAPATEFAKLQISRLEGMILTLTDSVQSGDLKAIDRALKIVDRLDRYHGFTRATRGAEPYGEEERQRLLDKINAIAARIQSDKVEE
jgi:DNA-binding transcriptional MerR regulator